MTIEGELEKVVPKVEAEFHRPTHIIMHEPSLEIFYAALRPNGVLFEGVLDPRKAIKEHRDLAKTIKEKTGAKIYYMRDLILAGTLDDKGQAIEGERLEKLRSLAKASLDYNYKSLNLQNRIEAEVEREMALRTINPKDLYHTIMSQVNLLISPNFDGHMPTQNELGFDPIYNLMFMRDQMITTSEGIILGNMNSVQRHSETEIVRFALEALGIEPLTHIKGDGRLEGGDYISAGNIGLIGVGKRTNKEAIEQLLSNQQKYFGNQILAVVTDSKSDQEHMHLDTYMNLLSHNTAVIVESRYIDGDNAPQVELYQGGRQIKHKNEKERISLKRFLQENDYKVIEISEEMQEAYGVNFLCTGEDSMIGVDIKAKDDFYRHMNQLETDIRERLNLGPKKNCAVQNYAIMQEQYQQHLKAAVGKGLDMTLVPLTHLNRAYGSVHCLTQVIRREQ